MSTPAISGGASMPDASNLSVTQAPTIEYNQTRLFWVSSLALCTAGIASALRASAAADLQKAFLDPIDRIHSAEQIGTILGVPFLAFAITIAISSPLLDIVGMGLLLPLAAILIPVGMLIMGFAGSLASGANIYWALWGGAAIAGVGWGLVETVMNPLIASLYPKNKTAKLNSAHAWWPGGLVIGGLLGYGMAAGGFSWQMKLGIVAVPALATLVLALGIKYPPTERAAAGVTMGEMFRELRRPMFLVLFCTMFLTAATELAPGQWVDLALTNTVHMPGILILVYVSALMFLMRHFAGSLVKRISPIGLLWWSSLAAAIGLWALSEADSPTSALVAATMWGVGVCYMWPTMLATASERFPKGGALLMGLMGTAGTLSIQFVLPIMGNIFDRKKIELAGGEAVFKNYIGDGLNQLLSLAAKASFQAVALVPVALLFVFAGIWFYDHSRGGFRPQEIGPEKKRKPRVKQKGRR
ncbi:MAG: MFS transporter [Acidobacteriota bacterium]